jgi:DNA-binding beta-propeller fold protein YncE
MVAASRTASALTFNLTYDTDAKLKAAGLTAADIVNMKAACEYAAKQFTDRYSDPINVNIKVTSSPGTDDLGSSIVATFDTVDSYAALRAAVAADATTADDATTVGAGGSLHAGADPITTTHMYNVTRAQGKALGLRPDDMLNDGSFNFGGGNTWTYDPNNRKVAGAYDFIGVALHEYSEIMGRNSIMGDDLGTGTPQFCEFDLFHYTGAGTRGLNNGPNRFFSFDNGKTLLIAFNDAVATPMTDLQDWAGPDPDAFNASGPTEEQDDLTPVDLQTMDIVGYNRVTGTTATTTLANISTRLRVETGDNVLIAGIIVTGNAPKKIMIRAIGPSLAIADKLANPTLELRDGSGALLEANDDWKQSPNKQAIIDSTIPPTNDLESAIVRTVPANGAHYTAIVRGVNNGTGIAVVQVYDLDTAADSRLANISTRGLVQTGDNVLFAGTIVVGPGSQKVIIRAIGPSLNVPGKMADPTLELRDGNGAVLEANDNWVDSPNKQAIIDSTIPPTNDLESAIVRTLPAGGANYTAIVRGVNDSTGIAVVEVYALATATPTPTPKLFIANGGNSTVTTSNLDGSGGAALGGNIGTLLMTPQGIAINATAGKIYAGNEGGDTITQANLDGSGAVNLTLNSLLKGPYGVALDVPGNKMYVANGGGGINGNTGFVVRANLDGSSATRLTKLDTFLTNYMFPQGIAIDVAGNTMYVAVQNSAIIVADLDGGNPAALDFGGLLAGTIPLDVALNVAGNRMYVVDFNGNLFSADLSGNNATNLGTLNGSLNAPRGMGLDLTGNKMYISNSGNNTVTEADLPNGANPVVRTIATLNSPAVVGVYRAP